MLIDFTLLVKLVAATLTCGVGHANVRDNSIELGSLVKWDGVLRNLD